MCLVFHSVIPSLRMHRTDSLDTKCGTGPLGTSIGHIMKHLCPSFTNFNIIRGGGGGSCLLNLSISICYVWWGCCFPVRCLIELLRNMLFVLELRRQNNNSISMLDFVIWLYCTHHCWHWGLVCCWCQFCSFSVVVFVFLVLVQAHVLRHATGVRTLCIWNKICLFLD